MHQRRYDPEPEDIGTLREAVDILKQSQQEATQQIMQEFHTVHDKLYDSLQDHYSDHTAHFEKIETTMATKDDIAGIKATQERQERLLQELLSRLPKPPES